MNGRRALWTGAQVALLAATLASGALLVGVARASSSDVDDLGEQIGWLNMATVGLVFAMCGVGAFLLTGRRTIGQRRLTLLPNVSVAEHASVAVEGQVDRWSWIPGTRRAHRPECQFVRGKASIEINASHIRAEGLRRCEVCGS